MVFPRYTENYNFKTKENEIDEYVRNNLNKKLR
jgi:hypothetical protein